MDLRDIDIYNPEHYVEAPPHAMFRCLREQAPVFRHAHPDGGHFWVLSRHADVVQASRDYKTFSAQRGFVLIDDLAPDLLQETQHQLLGMDPPNHGPIRRTVISRFTTRMVDAMEPWIRGRVNEILDRALQLGECDFVDDVAAHLPTSIICEIMSIPREDWDQVRHWADQQTSADDPDIVSSPEQAREASRAMGQYGYALAVSRRELEDPENDLISLLLRSEIDGARVDEMQFASLFIQITTAGNETTRNLLANGMLELMRQPQTLRLLEEQPGLWPDAVEEMLRHTCPLHYFRRTATRDTELRGQPIGEGDRVMLSYCSANRDEEVFPEPDTFDVRRRPNPHLAFGHGIHLCLGAHLARLEARVFFEELLRRCSRVDLNGEVRRVRSNLINGVKKMPVVLKAR